MRDRCTVVALCPSLFSSSIFLKRKKKRAVFPAVKATTPVGPAVVGAVVGGVKPLKTFEKRGI